MRRLIRLLVTALVMVASATSYGFGVERYVEGVHYTKVANPLPMPNSVTEFFSFGCPHCAHLEPEIENWLKHKPESAQFTRIPATWNARFEFLGKVYFALEQLGIAETSTQAMFDYIHTQNRTLRDAADVEAFVVERGIDKARFQQVWASEEIKAKLVEANEALARFKVSGVPNFLVNGEYMTSLNMAGSPDELFQVVEFLLTK